MAIPSPISAINTPITFHFSPYKYPTTPSPFPLNPPLDSRPSAAAIARRSSHIRRRVRGLPGEPRPLLHLWLFHLSSPHPRHRSKIFGLLTLQQIDGSELAGAVNCSGPLPSPRQDAAEHATFSTSLAVTRRTSSSPTGARNVTAASSTPIAGASATATPFFR